MTDGAIISIITTIIVMGLMTIGVQVTLFLYLLRRTDALSERLDAMRKEFSQEFTSVRQEISAVRQDVSALAERVARLEGIIIGRQEVGNGLTQTGDD
ncbi:MAG: hypothetical protein OXH22_10215 [Chloroflexi bacterium]|nr:hypothetical protein [Chloroflexota bacterium]